jgi:hypothetical protein
LLFIEVVEEERRGHAERCGQQLDQSLWTVLGLALASFQMVMCETWSPVALWMRKHTSQMK